MTANQDIIISYVLYESVHGKKPARNQRDNWVFIGPRIYGNKHYRIFDSTLANAERELNQIASRGGEWILKP